MFREVQKANHLFVGGLSQQGSEECKLSSPNFKCQNLFWIWWFLIPDISSAIVEDCKEFINLFNSVLWSFKIINSINFYMSNWYIIDNSIFNYCNFMIFSVEWSIKWIMAALWIRNWNTCTLCWYKSGVQTVFKVMFKVVF